jgi:hypothetical protein
MAGVAISDARLPFLIAFGASGGLEFLGCEEEQRQGAESIGEEHGVICRCHAFKLEPITLRYKVQFWWTIT